MLKSKLLFVLIVFAVALVASLTLSTPSVYAQPPLQGGATLSVDKAQYVIGEQIRTCFTVPAPAHLVFMVYVDDGTSWLTSEGDDDGTGDCIIGTAGTPAGRRRLRMTVYVGGRIVATPEVSYQVTDPQPPTQDPSTGSGQIGPMGVSPQGNFNVNCHPYRYAIPLQDNCEAWLTQDFPIPLYLEDSIPFEWNTPILMAIDEWNQALPFRFFSYRGRSRPPDDQKHILIYRYDRSSSVPGQTRNWTRNWKTYLSEIQLFDPAYGQWSQTEVRNHILHELGHTLGLNHSSDINDLMYWSGPSVISGLSKNAIQWTISSADLDTIIFIYFSR